MNNLTEEQRRLLLCAHEIGQIAGMLPLILLAPPHEQRTASIGLVRANILRVLARMDTILGIPTPSAAATPVLTAPTELHAAASAVLDLIMNEHGGGAGADVLVHEDFDPENHAAIMRLYAALGRVPTLRAD